MFVLGFGEQLSKSLSMDQNETYGKDQTRFGKRRQPLSPENTDQF